MEADTVQMPKAINTCDGPVLVSRIDPVADPAWRALVNRAANASVFHSPEWLRALHLTYGYRPVAFGTRDSAERLTDGVVFCCVNSWLTGNRLVSLPFSDHCQPLAGSPGALQTLVAAAKRDVDEGRAKYLEIRPLDFEAGTETALSPAGHFHFHQIDLTCSLTEIQARFHTTSIKQMIKRASREGLVQSAGRDERHLDWFYRLLLVTRQRHGVPPQPRRWFANVLACLGDAATIRVALKDGQPVAAIFTLAHKRTHYYKYGCSDLQFSRLGGTQMLLSNAILDAREAGAGIFDMGRSDPANAGLVEFKERWGAQRTELRYYRCPAVVMANDKSHARTFAASVFRRLPLRLQEAIGCHIYKHIG